MNRVGSQEEREAQLVLELTVRDLDASLRFYTALGFTIARQTNDFAALRFGSAWLFVTPGAPQPVNEHNLRVIVPDVDASWAIAQSLSAPVHRAIGDRSYGLRDFTISDPDGFQLRFAQVLRPSP